MEKKMKEMKKEIERIEAEYPGVRVEVNPTFVLKVIPKYSGSGVVHKREFTTLEALEEHLNDKENFLI